MPEPQGTGGRGGRAYYNEVDPFCAAWLRNLIAAGLITPGDVDERSIVDVRPADVAGYDRCHFFAGIAGWELALDLAGWGTEPVWTGSCPCQPFSAAGRQAGFEDARHLWPVWFGLIRECRPPAILGEQVEAAVRLGWLDAVFADLEEQGYACGAIVLGAHSVGAPHIRQRVWFVADADVQRQGSARDATRPGEPGRCGEADGVADAAGERQHRRELAGAAGTASSGRSETSERRTAGLRESAGCSATLSVADVLGTRLEGCDARSVGDECATAERGGAAGVLGNTERIRLRGEGCGPDAGAARGVPDQDGQRKRVRSDAGSTGADGPWSDVIWLPCRDGKARPTQPGLQPLVNGVPGRVGKLRAAGNAINPHAAAEFVAAYLDARPTP